MFEITGYVQRDPEYYQGFKDGYEVAKQEVRDFYERMGADKNCFTGTVCYAKQKESSDAS